MIGAEQSDLTPNPSPLGEGNAQLEWNLVCALRNNA
jgi:hypothetical protein